MKLREFSVNLQIGIDKRVLCSRFRQRVLYFNRRSVLDRPVHKISDILLVFVRNGTLRERT